MNEAKQETIKNAYGEYWEEAKDWINKNGFFNGEADHLAKLRTKLYMNGGLDIVIIDEVQFVRPKSLNGIENNNGWVKIEGEDDLPKEYLPCFIINKHGMYSSYFKHGFFYHTCQLSPITSVTHYQPITQPKPPIY